MNNNKPWYEKVGIWGGIIAGICTILGVSVFGSKFLIENSESDDESLKVQKYCNLAVLSTDNSYCMNNSR